MNGRMTSPKYSILVGIDPGGQCCHQLPVHRDLTGFDQLFAGAPRGHPGIGQDLLEPRPPGLVGVAMGRCARSGGHEKDSSRFTRGG